MRLGIIQFYDNEEGYIIDVETRNTYYLHSSAMKNMPFILNNRNYRGMPLMYSLYTNLYMSQVDDVMQVGLRDIADILGPVKPGMPWGWHFNSLIEFIKTEKCMKEAYLDQHKIFLD